MILFALLLFIILKTFYILDYYYNKNIAHNVYLFALVYFIVVDFIITKI